MVFATIMGVFTLLLTITSMTGIYENVTFPWSLMVFAAVFIIAVPLLVYYSAVKTYNTHSMLQEVIIYEMNEDQIRSTGESFSSEMDWSKLYKVEELKHWFLFYQNKQVANLIPKQAIGAVSYTHLTLPTTPYV
jgi:hypothetical protein